MPNLTTGYHPQASELPLPNWKKVAMVEDATVNKIASAINWLDEPTQPLNTSGTGDQAFTTLDLTSSTSADTELVIVSIGIRVTTGGKWGQISVRRKGQVAAGQMRASQLAAATPDAYTPRETAWIAVNGDQELEWSVGVEDAGTSWEAEIWLLGYIE